MCQFEMISYLKKGGQRSVGRRSDCGDWPQKDKSLVSFVTFSNAGHLKVIQGQPATLSFKVGRGTAVEGASGGIGC